MKNQEKKEVKKTKINQIKQHLKSKKSITSWEAIEKYGATRLAAHIFDLRELGWNISTQSLTKKDRNGNPCNYAKYILNE